MLIYDNISTGGILWRLESTEIRFRPDFCPEPRWENSPPLGELTMIRRPPSPLRGENSLPIPNPSTAFGVSDIGAFELLFPPQPSPGSCAFWIRPCRNFGPHNNLHPQNALTKSAYDRTRS